MVTPARWAALSTLRGIRRGDLLDHAFASAQEQVPTRERRWLQELVYGTVRLRGRLDFYLAQFVRRGLDSLHPDVHDALRLGAYQLLEMNSVPAYAAVSQAVDMVKELASRGVANMANGVLQSLRREIDTVKFPSFEEQPLEHLVTWGSHPRWLVERWIAQFGPDPTRQLVQSNNTRPELYIRPVRTSAAEARVQLAARNIAAEPVELAPDALRITGEGSVAEVFESVTATVQDPAAGLVVRYASVPPQARIADVCAAPGGKAVALADGASLVLASDISQQRLARVEQNIERIGDLPVHLSVADARQPAFDAVDVVLIDAPCTGTGTLRRHPDGRWRVTPKDLRALRELQAQILDACSSRVVDGGLLIYSTCSLEPEENEQQVDAFLQTHPEYAVDPPEQERVDSQLLDARGFLRVTPQRTGFDGAFAARLRRRAA